MKNAIFRNLHALKLAKCKAEKKKYYEDVMKQE